jgi:hypothetical protein
MFDTAHHGTPDLHRYRGYYDAQAGSTTQCAYCGRVIRFCYAMHDQNEKTFVIGTCHFSEYKGTKAYVQLRAARILQEALSRNIRHDLKYFGDKAEVRERRKAWVQARRIAERHVRTYVMLKGDWLPKELYELRAATAEKPWQYKLQGAAIRWYEKQTEKIIALTNQASSI